MLMFRMFSSSSRQTIRIFCSGCNSKLYKYKKRGNGSLVKCFVDRVLKDWTKGDMKCHVCSSEFARSAIIKNKPAHKIIGGKVYWR
mmetsp:Transcript_1874/g.3214  ORF Transcript_1874/g.3214 Transcript_1874/m.3214 type:complete len:86 (-) Transcript_1874:1428-1685(-)